MIISEETWETVTAVLLTALFTMALDDEQYLRAYLALEELTGNAEDAIRIARAKLESL